MLVAIDAIFSEHHLFIAEIVPFCSSRWYETKIVTPFQKEGFPLTTPAPGNAHVGEIKRKRFGSGGTPRKLDSSGVKV